MGQTMTWEECAQVGMTLKQAAEYRRQSYNAGWAYAKRNGLEFKSRQRVKKRNHGTADEVDHSVNLATPRSSIDNAICAAFREVFGFDPWNDGLAPGATYPLSPSKGKVRFKKPQNRKSPHPKRAVQYVAGLGVLQAGELA